jgi:two-component system sensor histidine kinase DcuS
VMQRNNLLFAVVTDTRGIRYSHPNPALLGKAFIGEDLRPARTCLPAGITITASMSS